MIGVGADAAQDFAAERVRLQAEVSRLAVFNRSCGLSWNVGWGKRGGLFDKKLDRLRARLLLIEVELSVTEQS